jgi:anti-anti-sigma factor
MQIREFQEGDVLVLAPDGSVAGSEETNAIETRLGLALKAGTRLLVIDCAAVGQLSSAAIRVLLMTSRKVDRSKGRLVLCGTNPKIKKAFSISGFDKDFTVVATREEALQRVLDPVPPRPSRTVKASPPKAAASPAVSVAPPVAVVMPAPAVPAARPVATDLTPPVQAAAPAAAAPGTPSPPVPDRRDALATAFLEALGVDVSRAGAARVSRIAPSEMNTMAGAILAALRVGRL